MSNLIIASLNPSTLAPIERRIEVDKHLQGINADICFIQESHLHQKHSVALKKYNCIRDDSGVGTAILIKTRFKFEQLFIPAISHINLTAIKIKFRNDKEVLAISIYIPCSSPANILKILNTYFTV